MGEPIASLQFLTQDLPSQTHIGLAKVVLDAGVRWIQYRTKAKLTQEMLVEAEKIKLLCCEYQSRLIINDNVFVAKEVDADGVHLGESDMPVSEARIRLGTNKIIGATVHSIFDLERLKDESIDYFGLGPFRYTSTKENIKTPIGLQGLKQVVNYTLKHAIHTPIVAIGGILVSDLKDIFRTKIHGVAVAGAISMANNQELAVKEFLSAFERRYDGLLANS